MKVNNKYREIDETILGVNKSSDAHFRWLVKLLSFIVKQETELPEITCEKAHEHCEFGLWLKQRMNEERDDKSFLIHMNHKHVRVHQVCKVLIDDIKTKGPHSDKFATFEEALLDFNASLSNYKQHLLQLRTSYDALTGLPLRRILDESFDCIAQKMSHEGMYLLLLDIDHFKRVNDTYGHLVGDKVLQELSYHLESNIRRSEPTYRYGGEEFIMILQANSHTDAFYIAERIRKIINNLIINSGEHNIKITFTAGLTQIHTRDTLHGALERADVALYKGKHSGRNCCVFADTDMNITRITPSSPVAVANY